jgi:prepilin-type N-terminal cleavage/methylation domain-containing protein
MKRGFTLIELMIVLLIGLLIGAIVVSVFYDLLKDQSLKKDFASVVALTERARSMAMNSKNNSAFGTHFASSSISLFSGITYATSSVLEKYDLNSRVEISSVSLGGVSDLWFAKITGYSSASGTVSLSLKNNATSTKTITIFSTGIIQH